MDAIELTSIYDLTGKSREEMLFDREKLLSVYDETVDVRQGSGPDSRGRAGTGLERRSESDEATRGPHECERRTARTNRLE